MTLYESMVISADEMTEMARRWRRDDGDLHRSDLLWRFAERTRIGAREMPIACGARCVDGNG